VRRKSSKVGRYKKSRGAKMKVLIYIESKCPKMTLAFPFFYFILFFFRCIVKDETRIGLG